MLPPNEAPRVASLDVLRGLAVAAMILVNNPGNWNHLFAPLAHAPWHGCTFADMVFPFFLFAVGNALALASPGWRLLSLNAFSRRWAWRTGLLFALGLMLNAAPFVVFNAEGPLVWRDASQLRWMGVLQRIAMCWGLAALCVWWLRGQAWAIVAVCITLLLGYWGLMWTLAQGADAYSLEGFFGTHWDRALLGAAHLYKGEGVPFDPEGLASTLPGVAQVLMGWLAGQALSQRQHLPWQRLALWGAALFMLGLGWSQVLPLNKKLWTSSYALYTTGLAVITLALLARWLDHRRVLPAPARVLGAFGKNALFIFVLSGLLPRLAQLIRRPDGLTAEGTPRFVTLLPWVYRTFFADVPTDPRLASLAYALAHLACYAALAWWMNTKRLYIKV
jgi:predicted acyltransferase